MEDYIDFIYLGVAILIIILSWFFSRAQKTIRLFKSRNIQECKDNYICKVQGKLVLVSPEISAPLSGRKCAVYRVIVEEYRSSRRYGKWIEIIDDERKTNFVIQNDGQIALVICSGAALLLHKDRTYKSGTFNDATDMLNKYLESLGKVSTNFLGFNKSIRYKEGVLEDGEDISIYGSGQWKSTEEYEELKIFNVSKVYVFKGTSQVILNISDDPRILDKN